MRYNLFHSSFFNSANYEYVFFFVQ